MMQAGDVETNPGPSCPVCDRVITANHTPMPCVACGVAVHGACTGLSRARREKGERYICRGCGGVRERERCAVCSQTFRTNSRRVPCRSCGLEVHGSCSALTREALRRGDSYECSGFGERGIQPPPDPPSQEGRVEKKGERCVVCQVTLRRGAGCACCPGCNRKAHKKCVDRRVEGWRCGNCGGPVPAAPPDPALPPPGPPPPPDPALPPGPPPPPETRNERCPECNIRLRRALDPLVCRACGLQYHTKCSGLTRDALAVQRRAGTWRCGTCTRQEERRVQLPEVRELTSLKAAHKLKTLKLLQWNCDGLATKKDELEELMQRRGVHVALIQETKLGGKDRTPNIRGYTVIRKDRQGSGTTKPRAGGLCAYIMKELPFWEKSTQTQGILEAQRISIPNGTRSSYDLVNFYVPPVRGEGAVEEWRVALNQLRALRVQEGTMWCGDINAHNDIWDPYVQPDRRGEDVVELLAEKGLATLNDGNATRYERADRGGGAGRSAPDVTVVRMEECEGVLWNTIQDLSSDHVPIEIEWKKETRINKKIRRVEPNLRKGDWDKYRSEMEQRIGPVSGENNMKRKLEKLTSLMCEVAAEVCPARVVREEAIPWVTAEIRQLRRERNRARRDMTRRRGEWMEKCRELKEKTREAKREVWRKQLSKIQEEKNINRAWRVIKGLKGEKQGEHSGAMLYEGRWRVTPRSKANAFMQEYANISKSISNRATRQEKRRVAKHLRGMRPRREIEKEFTILELKNCIKSLKNGKAPGPDEIRPEYLKYLPLAAMEQVLVLANYSWRHSWVPQKWRTATIVPILKKGKEPSQVGSYRSIITIR